MSKDREGPPIKFNYPWLLAHGVYAHFLGMDAFFWISIVLASVLAVVAIVIGLARLVSE